MKIAIYHNLPSGGAKRTLYEAVRKLIGKHSFDVYTLSSANQPFADIQSLVTNHYIYQHTPLKLFRSPFGRLNQAVRVIDLLRIQLVNRKISLEIDQANYDLIMVEPCQFEVSPSLLRYLKHTSTIYYCHEPLRRFYEPMPERPYDRATSKIQQLLNRVDPLPYLYLNLMKYNDRRNIRAADSVLVNSQFIQNSVRSSYGIESNISYHGVDTDFFRPIGLQKSDFILSVGSLTPLKSFDFLIFAVATIPIHERPDLVIASNFQNSLEKNYVEQLASEQGVCLKLLSNVTDADLLRLYNQARVTVYAPIREPFGLVPLESMSCATPVVAVSEGGMLETVTDGINGLLVDREPKTFGSAIRELWNDRKRASLLGNNGRQHVISNWTWEQAATRLENYFYAIRQAN